MSRRREPGLPDRRHPTALIVDDMRVNRMVLEAQLRRLGYACRQAASGPEAIAACREAAPDVVLLDVVMPQMNGLEALAEIRKQPACRAIPAIMLTGLEHDEIADRAAAAGACEVLGKPPDPRALARVLRTHVRVAPTPPEAAAAGARPSRGAGRRSRVLVVDDSALVREVLSQVLGADPELEVVGTARDAERAWKRIQALKPDVLTLDVEMPGMDGITFLERLMRLRPLPVIMVSSLTERGSKATLRALELGAIDFVCKPRIDLKAGTTALADEIIRKVKVAARARLPVAPAHPIAPATADGFPRVTQAIVALGASTGGPKALGGVLAALPRAFPPVVVTQHMPGTFTRSFAARLDGQCDLTVVEAQGGEALRRGTVYIAPGEVHMRIAASALGPVVALDDGPPVNHHRPSVDVLFESVAQLYGPHAVAALLTGMGADGARGLGAIRSRGGRTIAQDEGTSLVYGMPRVAVELGAAEHVLPLERVPRALVKLVATTARRRRRA